MEPKPEGQQKPTPAAGSEQPPDVAIVASKVRRHWYRRISPGARMLFWSIYFGIFVVAAVVGIVIALLELAVSPEQMMHNPVTSLFILVTGTVGEMWCLHRNLGIYMLDLPSKEYARWGIYISGGALMLSFLLALTIVILYLNQ